MESRWEILFIALLISAGWSFPHHSRPTCALCPPGTKLLHACTSSSDTVCIPCDPDTYSDASSNSTTCQRCSKCQENTYISKPCSPKSDSICSPCSTSPQMKSKYYLASCGPQDTVKDPHDVMMGDDAAAVPPEGDGNNENDEEVPAESVKEGGGDNTHADEAKDVEKDNKDNIPDTANDDDNMADDGNEKKEDDAKKDTADNVDKKEDGGNHEGKDGETAKTEAENEHVAGGGDGAAKNAADDTLDERAHNDEAAHDTADETSHNTADDTAPDTPDETSHNTADDTAHDTADETSHNTADDTGHDTADETAHDTADDTVHNDKTAHDTTDGTADEKADETPLDTEDGATDDAGDEVDDNTTDKVPNEAGEAGEGEEEAVHISTDEKADTSAQDPEDDAASDVGGKTEVVQGDNAANETKGDEGDVVVHKAGEDNEDLNSPRVLEPEHKEFIDPLSEGTSGSNDTAALVDTHDGPKGNASDDYLAGVISLDNTDESDDPSSKGDVEHDEETLGSIHEHAENTTDVEDTHDEEPEEETTEAPEDSKVVLHAFHAGIEEPHSDDSNKTTEAEAETDEGFDNEPAIGRVMSEETTNATQAGDVGSQEGNTTASPQPDGVVGIGVVNVDENEEAETGLTDEDTTLEPDVTSESLDVPTEGDDAADVAAGVIDDHEGTTIPPEHSTEEGQESKGEFTTTVTAEDNSTADDSELSPVVIHGLAKDGTKDADEVEAEATTHGTAETDAEEAKTQDVEDVEGKTTKRIPSLEELEAMYTDSDTETTTTDEFSDAGNIPLSDEQKTAENDAEYEDNKSTAIIVGVTVGGVALFALAFFASRYYKKRRGHFKEMKKVNSNKDGEALEFEPLKSRGNNIYDDPEIPPTNGIYRPRGKASPPFPLKSQREEKVDAADLYAVPEKSKRAPLLGASPPIEELSQSPSAQEPLISGVEKLKYIDDSTDDEYVNTVRTSLLPARSPASRLSNVVEETPPTSPSITQQYRPNWSANQSKSGGSSSYTNGSTPKHPHSSVSSQGSLTNDVMSVLSNQTPPKTDTRNKGGRVHRKQVASDEDIEC